jgi:hypothetical protein
MKYLNSYQLFEQNLEQSRAELKYFQDEMQLTTNFDKLLDSIDAVELSANTIFPFLTGSEKIDSIDDNPKFQEELDERKLKISELFDTDDDATLIKVRIKYYWIYPEESGELDLPLYLILQYYHPEKEKWSTIKMYYVQKDIQNFYTELSSVTMVIKRRTDPSKTWTYTTSNSGMNWILDTPDTATETFKKNLEMDDIETLANHSQIEITFQ